MSERRENARPAADELRRGRLLHRARHRGGGPSESGAHHRREAGSAAGYKNYQQWLAGTQLEQRVSLEDYSVSNRGLRSGLVGTPEQVADRIGEFEGAGVDLLLLQFSPQVEEMERFSESRNPPRHAPTPPHTSDHLCPSPKKEASRG